MIFTDLMKSFSELDEINKELEELKNPEVIEKRANSIFTEAWKQNKHKEIESEINNIFASLL